jgi:DNA-binding transcriptional regulator PaaX
MNLKKIITNMSGYQPQTIRNNINDLCTFGYLARKRRGKDAFYVTTDNGRNVLEGKEIVQSVQEMGSGEPDQIMLTNFTGSKEMKR